MLQSQKKSSKSKAHTIKRAYKPKQASFKKKTRKSAHQQYQFQNEEEKIEEAPLEEELIDDNSSQSSLDIEELERLKVNEICFED